MNDGGRGRAFKPRELIRGWMWLRSIGPPPPDLNWTRVLQQGLDSNAISKCGAATRQQQSLMIQMQSVEEIGCIAKRMCDRRSDGLTSEREALRGVFDPLLGDETAVALARGISAC